MIRTIKSLYKTECLNGEFLIRPLKSYHNFFADKIENSSGLKKIAWVITHVVTGVLAYPILGVLAGIGMLIKLTGVPGLKKHNQAAKNDVKMDCAGIKHAAAGYGVKHSGEIMQRGYEMQVIREFKITKQNVDGICSSINQAIDSLTTEFKKLYPSSRGVIEKGEGEITFQLRIQSRV